MALKTHSGKTLISKRIVLCKTTLSQMRGLMFARNDPERALIMVFEDENLISLHMMFVFFPIDILYLNKGRKIVEMHKGAKPFISHIRPRQMAKYIVELPAGVIKAKKLRLGDRLAF